MKLKSLFVMGKFCHADIAKPMPQELSFTSGKIRNLVMTHLALVMATPHNSLAFGVLVDVPRSDSRHCAARASPTR